MPNYLLILRDEPAMFAEMSPEEMQAVLMKYIEWSQRMRASGVVTDGHKLKDGEGHVIRKGTVLDGPYTETKEVVGGFYVIQAPTYDKALEIARSCPHVEYGSIELREIEVL